MLSIVFKPKGEWWVSSAVFDRLFQSALDHGEIAPAMGHWHDIVTANGGFDLSDAPVSEAEQLTLGLHRTAERELVLLREVTPQSEEGTYRASLLKLLAAVQLASD
jgi:hypothetical protein